jgi:hypothetical protein
MAAHRHQAPRHQGRPASVASTPDRDGLVLRVSAKGARTWTVSYRVRGRGDAAGEGVAAAGGDKRRLTLGDYPTVGLSGRARGPPR